MKTKFLILAHALSLFACANANNQNGAPEPAAQNEVNEGKTLIAQARARLDVNKDLAPMKAELERALAAERIATADTQEARLLIAKLDLALGAKEAAADGLEAVIASQGPHSDSKIAREASEALRDAFKVPNRGASVVPVSAEGDFSPVALALADYFPAKSGSMTVKILTFGGRGASAEKDTTFEIGDAARSKAGAACQLCARLSVSTSFSRHGDWTGMLSERAAAEESLVVYYYDLGANKIPERYDASLPMPTKAIDAELAKDSGLIVVKQRPGKPPVILLAAPRTSQLRAVQSAFAEMKTLPDAPVPVKVKTGLMADEIQGVVRSSYKNVKGCYETLLEKTPQAAGKFEMEFAVDGEGHVKNPKISSKDEPLRETTFLACVTKYVESLEFPATRLSGDTTVRYPITVHP
jgi:hypothetical protein